MKFRAIFLLLLLLIGSILCIDQFAGERNTKIHELCNENLDENHDALLALMSIHQGEFINRDSESFRSFAVLFDGDLAYVDLREPKNIVFSFSTLHPEISKRLIYCQENRLRISAYTYLETNDEEMRLENLGIDQTGYIQCARLKDGWFYWESYLPT